tara:strand:+ start:238 stop:462 length:225 start_codon:yes stop_codon:yes gene_type:complete
MANVGDIVREVNSRPSKERIRGIVIKKDISDGFGLFVEVFWFTDETDKDELFKPHASVTQVENLEIISSCQRTG